MISVAHIDRLAGALALDCILYEAFLSDRLGAIEQYNNDYVRRFGEKPIELNEEERQLVLSLPADSIEHFYEMLNLTLSKQHKPTRRLAEDNLVYADPAA